MSFPLIKPLGKFLFFGMCPQESQVPVENLDIKLFLLQDYQEAFQTAKSGHYTKMMFSVMG